MSDQLKTAQVYALELVRVSHEMEALELNIKRLGEAKAKLVETAIQLEGDLLDCLDTTASKTYLCGDRCVTVVKALGEPSKIYVTEAISG